MGNTLNPVVSLAEAKGLALAHQNPQIKAAVAAGKGESGRGLCGRVAVP